MKKKLLVILLALICISCFTLAACNGNKGPTEVTVTFDANGGTFSGGAATITKKVTKGKAVTMPTTAEQPALAGHDFVKWTTTKDGPNTGHKSTAAINADTTLYAYWDKIADPSPKYALNNLIYSLDNVINELSNSETGLFAEGTIYLKFGEIQVSLSIKGNFDSSNVSANMGYLNVNVNGTDYVTVYVKDNYVYIGEALTQDELYWVKLSQFESEEFISHYFAQLPELLAENIVYVTKRDAEGNITGSIKNDILSKMEIDIPFLGKNTLPALIGMIWVIVGDMDLFTATVPNGDASKLIDGNYTLGLNLAAIPANLGDLINTFVGEDASITDLLAGLGDDIGAIIDIVADYLLNGNLDDYLAGELTDVLPELSISYTVKEKKLSDLALKFVNETKDLDVEFGISGLTVSKTAKAASEVFNATDTANIGKAAGEACIKLSVDVEIPGLELDLGLDVYLNPALILSVNETTGNVNVNFDNVTAYAVANFAGKEIPVQAEYYYDSELERGVIIFDLYMLFNFFGIECNPGQATYAYYGFDLGSWIDGLVNAEPEPVDPLPKYTVTFTVNGGTHDTNGAPLVQQIEKGSSATAPTITRSGQYLTWDKAFDNITENITVNAVWTSNTKKYTVTFDANGGTHDTKGAALTQQIVIGSGATAPTLTKTGYILSWDAKFDVVTGDITVKAIWTKNNKIDKLVNGIIGIIDGNTDIMSFIMGSIWDVLSLVTDDIMPILKAGIVTTDTTITISLMDLLVGLSGAEIEYTEGEGNDAKTIKATVETLIESEILNDLLMEHLGVSTANLLTMVTGGTSADLEAFYNLIWKPMALAYLNGLEGDSDLRDYIPVVDGSVEDAVKLAQIKAIFTDMIMQYIENFTGYTEDNFNTLLGKALNMQLTLGYIRSAEEGLGISLSISIGGTKIVSLAITIDIIADTDIPAYIPLDPEAATELDDDSYKALMALFNALYDQFMDNGLGF